MSQSVFTSGLGTNGHVADSAASAAEIAQSQAAQTAAPAEVAVSAEAVTEAEPRGDLGAAPASVNHAGGNGNGQPHDQPGGKSDGVSDSASSSMQKWLPGEAGKPLSKQQHQALEMLTAGVPIREAAVKIGVARQSVYRWIRKDAGFRAAYHAWQQEHRESCRAGLLRCAETAVARVATMVEHDQRLAFAVCKELGLFKQVDAASTIEPEMVQSEIDVEKMKERSRIYGQQMIQMLKNAGLTTEQARECIRRRAWELEHSHKSRRAPQPAPADRRGAPVKRRKRAPMVGAFGKLKMPKMNARVGTLLTRSSALRAFATLSPGMAKKLLKGV